MNEEIKQCVWLKEGGHREKLKVPTRLGSDSVTTVTDRELKLPLSVKELPLFLWFELARFVKWKTQSFPHFRVNRLRVFTKPAL